MFVHVVAMVQHKVQVIRAIVHHDEDALDGIAIHYLWHEQVYDLRRVNVSFLMRKLSHDLDLAYNSFESVHVTVLHHDVFDRDLFLSQHAPALEHNAVSASALDRQDLVAPQQSLPQLARRLVR